MIAVSCSVLSVTPFHPSQSEQMKCKQLWLGDVAQTNDVFVLIMGAVQDVAIIQYLYV